MYHCTSYSAVLILCWNVNYSHDGVINMYTLVGKSTQRCNIISIWCTWQPVRKRVNNAGRLMWTVAFKKAIMHSTFKRKAILREQVNAPQELVFRAKKSVTWIKEKHIFLSAHRWERIIIYSWPGTNFPRETFGAHLTRRCEVWYVFPTETVVLVYIHTVLL
jgi:hypothetical protein